jgi:hypothetical protein
MAFRRPSELRIEVGGPSLRLVVVTRDGDLTAVFPRERAVYSGPAEKGVLRSLVGVELDPGEIMDLVVGKAPARLRDVRFSWGNALPERVEATLPDGTRLKARLLAPEAAPPLPEGAFVPPRTEGFRKVGIEEARALLEHA